MVNPPQATPLQIRMADPMSLLGFDFDVPKVDMDEDEVSANLGVHVTYKPSLYLQMLRQLEAFSHFNALQQISQSYTPAVQQTDLGELDSRTQLPGPPLNIHLPNFVGDVMAPLYSSSPSQGYGTHPTSAVVPSSHPSMSLMWGADNESFYAAPESAGPSRFSPYSSLYQASASGSTASRSRCENAQRSQVEYWKLPGCETELAIIRIAFLKGHIYKMRR